MAPLTGARSGRLDDRQVAAVLSEGRRVDFGSGLVIVPFLQQDIVRQYGWLNEHDFLVAAAIGTILGACILLGRIAIGDGFTLLIALAALLVLFRWKVSNPLLMAVTAVAGLIAFPLLQPTWVMLK